MKKMILSALLLSGFAAINAVCPRDFVAKCKAEALTEKQQEICNKLSQLMVEFNAQVEKLAQEWDAAQVIEVTSLPEAVEAVKQEETQESLETVVVEQNVPAQTQE